MRTVLAILNRILNRTLNTDRLVFQTVVKEQYSGEHAHAYRVTVELCLSQLTNAVNRELSQTTASVKILQL